MTGPGKEAGVLSGELPTRDDIVSLFNSVWIGGRIPSVDDFARQLERERLCGLAQLVQTDMKFRFVSNPQLRIEDYLLRYSELVSDPDALCELIHCEYLLRCRHHLRPSVEEYERRFPQVANELADLLRRTSPKPPGSRGTRRVQATPRPERVLETQASDGSIPTGENRNPDRLGRFESLTLLGSGTHGSVYRAYDTQLERHVALKIPRAGMLDSRKEIDQFFREARAAAQLQHPNIVPIHDSGEVGGMYFITSALVEGQSLRRVLAREVKFSVDEAVSLVGRLAAALHYAHNRGVVHRDVKPENIILDDHRQPHLMDFGLAHRDEGQILRTQEGIVLGTPAYMSPEQALGKSHLADARSDLWSLGVILYEMLSGRRPFDGELKQLIVEIAQREPKPLRSLDRNIPVDLDAICGKCLAKDPDRRYASCQHLADDLRRFSKGQPIEARRLTRMQRLRKWCRRNPAIAGLSVATIVLLLAGTVASSYFALQAKSALARLETQKAVVDQALSHSEQTIANYVDAVRELSWVGEEQQGEAVHGLLKNTLAYYQRLINQESGRQLPPEHVAAVMEKIGEICSACGDTDGAIKVFQQRISLLKKLVGQRPQAEHPRFQLAQSHTYLGNLYEVKGDSAKAKQQYEQAIELQLRLSQMDPQGLARTGEFAALLINLGTLAAQIDRADVSEDLYNRGLAVVSNQPAPTERRDMVTLGRGYQGRATLMEQLQQYEHAIRDWDKAIAVADADQRAELKIGRARTIALSGNSQAAWEEIKELSCQPLQATDLLDAVRVLCVALKQEPVARLDQDQAAPLRPAIMSTAGQLIARASAIDPGLVNRAREECADGDMAALLNAAPGAQRFR